MQAKDTLPLAASAPDRFGPPLSRRLSLGDKCCLLRDASKGAQRKDASNNERPNTPRKLKLFSTPLYVCTYTIAAAISPVCLLIIPIGRPAVRHHLHCRPWAATTKRCDACTTPRAPRSTSRSVKHHMRVYKTRTPSFNSSNLDRPVKLSNDL